MPPNEQKSNYITIPSYNQSPFAFPQSFFCSCTSQNENVLILNNSHASNKPTHSREIALSWVSDWAFIGEKFAWSEISSKYQIRDSEEPSSQQLPAIIHALVSKDPEKMMNFDNHIELLFNFFLILIIGIIL